MNKLEEINSKIKVNKEVLETLPKNNAKNIKKYIEEIDKLKTEFTNYQASVLEEIEKRYKKITNVHKSTEVNATQQKVENSEGVMYLLNDIDTSYEKMDLDKAMFNLNHYYKTNLEIVNETISYCIKKFEEIGIELELKDFDYSEYVKEYFMTFFREMENENINSKKVKSKFDEIYWKCPELIYHIVLNIRYIYGKNEKNIDKYYNKQKENLLKKFTAEDLRARFMELKKQLDEEISKDKSVIIKKFTSGELNVKDYTQTAIIENYARFIAREEIDLENINKMNEIDLNLQKLLNSLYEYKKYLKFKFIIEDVKQIYSEKDKYKNTYAQIKKEIDKKEKKRISLNNKINKKGFMKKSDEKNIDQRNSLILELKQLYKDLDNNKVYNTIITKLNDNSTLKDALYLASSFYKYLYMCICNNNKDIEETEVNEIIEGLREFMKYPYNTILNNVKLLEERDIMLTIKDRYQLLDINIQKEDLEEENLDGLIETIQKIEIAHNIRKNKIDLEEIACACEFKKILNK
ncbi:MAG: hypothetical protein J6A29_04640 [Clostridia bacterium]|nr:hypothetical protein [Clostridia bacterium]